MSITNTKVTILQTKSNLKALASITIDDCFVVHNLKIIQSDKGLFVCMPNKKMANGEYKDIAHPLNTQTRNDISSAVLTAYKKAIDENNFEM